MEPYLGRYPKPIPISNSEIQLFKSCRRSWYLTYYLGLRKKARSILGPLPLGTRVHAALEAYHRDSVDPVEAYIDLFEADKNIFYSNAPSELAFARAVDSESSDEDLLSDREKKFLSEGELGRIMIEGYLDWLQESGVASEYEIIDVENANRYLMMDGRVELIGKMDIRLKSKNENATYIGDVKTAAQFTEYDNIASMSEQLMLYTILERLCEPDRPVEGGVYLVLKKVKRTGTAKPPFYKKYTIRFNEATLNSFWIRMYGQLTSMLEVRDALDAGADHRRVAYPTVTRDCVWKCPFYAACSMFDDGSSIDLWLHEFTEQGDPYERYNEVDTPQ